MGTNFACCCRTYTIPEVIEAMKSKQKRFLALGIVMLILGAAAVVVPNVATFAVEIFVGWLFTLCGAIQAICAFQSRKARSFFLHILGAVLYLAAGVLLLAYPLQGEITLTAIVVALFIVGGAFKIVAAIQLRSVPNWGWLLVSGIVTLMLGAFIWANWPGDAVWVIGLLVGIDLVFNGLWMTALSYGLRKS